MLLTEYKQLSPLREKGPYDLDKVTREAEGFAAAALSATWPRESVTPLLAEASPSDCLCSVSGITIAHTRARARVPTASSARTPSLHAAQKDTISLPRSLPSVALTFTCARAHTRTRAAEQAHTRTRS